MFKLTNLIVLLSIFCVVAIAAPYQELPPKPGYVPVYIREGNTPLSQVNPKLVAAFHEDEESNQPQIEAENPKEVEVTKNEAENKQQNEKDTKKETKQLNEVIDNNKDGEKQEQEKEVPVSDIAEFTIDDIKKFGDDKTAN